MVIQKQRHILHAIRQNKLVSYETNRILWLTSCFHHFTVGIQTWCCCCCCVTIRNLIRRWERIFQFNVFKCNLTSLTFDSIFSYSIYLSILSSVLSVLCVYAERSHWSTHLLTSLLLLSIMQCSHFTHDSWAWLQTRTKRH